MIKLMKKRSTTAVLIALTLTGCTRFDTRMQPDGNFNYQNAQLVPAYQTGTFSSDETREHFALPALTESQVKAGHLANDVDIRPPTQLIPVIDGVMVAAKQQDKSTVWFNAFKQDDDVKEKVWQLLESYLAANNIDIKYKDDSLLQLETAPFTKTITYGDFISHNEVVREASYRFAIDQQSNAHRAALTVELLSYSEANDGVDLKFTPSVQSKKNVEIRFVNDLLAFAYDQKEVIEQNSINSHPLPIKLAFDDNHQTVWSVDSSFVDTWSKLPDLLSLLHFELIEENKSLGYYLIKFKIPVKDYWQENNLNPFFLKEAEYIVQLGEMSLDTTSISWLDAKKKPLSAEKISEIYLSITEQVRSVILQKETQTKAL